MRSTLKTAEDYLGAIAWEEIRAGYFDGIGAQRRAEDCRDLIRQYQTKLKHLESQSCFY